MNALVRELQGLGHVPGSDSAAQLLFNASSSQLPDDFSVSRLSTALNIIVRHAAPARLDAAVMVESRANRAGNGAVSFIPILKGQGRRTSSTGPEVSSQPGTPNECLVHQSASTILDGILSSLVAEKGSSDCLNHSRSLSLKMHSAAENASPWLHPTEQVGTRIQLLCFSCKKAVLATQ